MKEREYQVYAVDSLFHYWEQGKTGNPLIAAPTGTGKSVIIASAIRRMLNGWPRLRVMVLTHVKELIAQNFDKLRKMWPSVPAGIYSAGLNKKESHFPITFAGIASVVDCPELFGHIDIIFIDEAHLVSLEEDAMYNKFIKAKKAENPNLVVVGLTATPFRQGQGSLVDGEGLFTDICCNMCDKDAFNWFIDEGFLVNLVPFSTFEQYDVSKVRKVAGEYDQKQLQNAVDQDGINRRVVAELLDKSKSCNKVLVFAAGIKHTENIARILEESGESATYVHSKMKEKERDKRIAEFKAGKYRFMVNNGILTTGFDDPEIDCIAMLRPTHSVGLWIQMLGRGTRPCYAEGFDLDTQEGRLSAIKLSQKPVCLVLDFAGNTARLGPINDPVLPRKKGEKAGEAPVRICDSCGMYNHASAAYCFNCGQEFPRSPKILAAASTKQLVAREDQPIVQNIKVDRVTYNAHIKTGKPTSIRVTYYCGLSLYREYVCLEHGGYPARVARMWWKERSGEDAPETVVEALSQTDSLRIPAFIRVWINRKPPEILGYEYEPEPKAA